MMVCLGFGIGTSGIFSFMGIEGPDAIRIYMDRGVAAMSTDFASARRFVTDNIGTAKAQIEAVQAKLDASATSRGLGWEPQVSLRESLREMATAWQAGRP